MVFPDGGRFAHDVGDDREQCRVFFQVEGGVLADVPVNGKRAYYLPVADDGDADESDGFSFRARARLVKETFVLPDVGDYFRFAGLGYRPGNAFPDAVAAKGFFLGVQLPGGGGYLKLAALN